MEHDQPCQPRDDEQYVWPWIGVLVNVPTEWKNRRRVGEIGRHLREQFSQFCACKVTRLWYKRGHTGSAIVEFANDWSGFKNALDYENHFEAQRWGKRHWLRQKFHGPEMFGWVARADDYYTSHGRIRHWLQSHGDVKTVADLKNAEERKDIQLQASLHKQVDLQELECKFNESTKLFGKGPCITGVTV